MNVLTTTSHSGQKGPTVVGVGVGIDVEPQNTVSLCISQISEHIIVRHSSDPMGSMSNITSPKVQKTKWRVD